MTIGAGSRGSSGAVQDARPTETQRIAHLVLGAPRPKGITVGRGRSKRQIPVVLAPGIEEQVELRERWSHKQGTPQTHEHFAAKRDGAIARLHASRAITDEQLQSAAQIAAIAERIRADVIVKTANLEGRVDTARHGDGFFEQLKLVRREIAYSRWRTLVQRSRPKAAAIVLDMLIGDDGLTIVARRHGMHHRRARQLLVDALDIWPAILLAACGEVDEATLAAAQAGILA